MTSSPPTDPHGKLSTAEIVRQMTGGETPRHVDFGRWLQAGPPDVVQDMAERAVRTVQIHAMAGAPGTLPASVPIPTIEPAPTPIEIAVAELTLIETKLRKFADEQGAIAILRRAEDIAIVRKMLEGRR